MSGCDLYLEKRARETDGEIKTGRGPILPALFSGVRLRRPRVCQRSRRAGRCTDSSLHAGRLLFTKKEKKKKERSSFIGCWSSPDVGITVRSQGSETIPMGIIFTSRFHLGSTVHPCGRSPEFQASHLSLL